MCQVSAAATEVIDKALSLDLFWKSKYILEESETIKYTFSF